MKCVLIFLLFILSLPLFAETISFRNDREGESYYQKRSYQRAMKRALRDVSEANVRDAFKEVLSETESKKLCAYDLNDEFQRNLQNINPDFDQLDGAIFFLRSKNDIDDSVTRILLKAFETMNTRLDLPKEGAQLIFPKTKITQKVLPIISSFTSKYLPSTCFDEAYRSLYSDILKIDSGIKSYHLEALFVAAHQEKLIDYETYLLLEKARKNDIQGQGLSLKDYYQKIQSLRKQYPLRDTQEKSNFVTEEASRMKLSRRQKLIETYSDIQIIMMGNVIKKLRTRLESPKAEILIYDRSQGVETIILEPMERFRLAIKLLRKEMSYISSHTYFGGRSPDYMDLMTAAFETGIIPASELDELGGLQDIWNPKRTFWEKARTWVQTLSTVATIVIPPPYGFIPALAIVVIEATTGQSSDPNGQDPTSLF